MIFEQHYLDCLSQASYLIADETTKRAVVVDPRRDVSPYLETAAEHGLAIELVIETHFHADFLSGHLELADATGAQIAYGSVAETEFESRKLVDGERISLGQVELEIRHTPGHTPESISIVVCDHAESPEPWGVLTGDTLFIGDVGRPDLLSSKGVTSEELASDLYDSLHTKLMSLPDATRLWPGHGAGSSCGKNLSTNTSCSIGVQRETNYAVADMTKDEFVEVVTSGQTAPPAYFGFDAVLNREMRPILDEHQAPAPLELDEVVRLQADGAVVLDTRGPEVFASGHLVGSVNIGLGGRYAEFAGGVLLPDMDIVLVGEPGTELEAKVRLARIGFDRVVGHLIDPERSLAAAPEHVGQSSRFDVAAMVDAMASVDGLQVLDVRQPGETEGGVVDGAVLIPLTKLRAEMDSLDRGRPVAVYCAGGFRSSIAASLMKLHGFDDVTDLLGGWGAWTAAHTPA
jgi:hydroxyacylglutathione hydrolase